MSIGIIPDASLARALDLFFGNTLGSSAPILMLFQNDIAEVDIIALSDLVECDFDGYAPKPLNTNPGFPTVVSHVALGPFVEYRWDKAAGTNNNDVYGVALYLGGFTELLYAHRFTDAPRPMALVTDSVIVNFRGAMANG